MLYFNDWTLCADGQVIAQQFDNLTRTLVVKGDIPADWTWTMLVQVGEAMDILPLTFLQEGLGIILSAQQLSISGYCTMQLRATRGELVRHTNSVCIYVPASLSGDEQWPAVPSEFTDLERRATEAVHKAERSAGAAENGAELVAAAEINVENAKKIAQNAASTAEQSAAGASASAHAAEQAPLRPESHTAHPPVVGENGNWLGWDGVRYVDSGKPSQGELTTRQGNTLYANAVKGTASGALVRLDDVSPLEHNVPVRVSGVPDLSAVTVYRHGRNLCPKASVTTQEDHAGRVFLRAANYPFLQHGTYTFSADVTVYAEDSVTIRWFDWNVFYEDGTYDLARIAIPNEETLRDGVARHYSVKGKTNQSKRITQIVLTPLSHNGTSGSIRNAKAENLQFEFGGTETAYEPYTAPITYPVSEDGNCEVVSMPVMTLSTDNPNVVVDCEYNRDINKAIEHLTQAIISMGGNI